VAAIDLLLRARFPAAYGALPRLDDTPAPARLAALLYGGITEEIVMRFGLMSALAVFGIRVLGRRPPRPRRGRDPRVSLRLRARPPPGGARRGSPPTG
jgi:hypothetical protein